MKDQDVAQTVQVALQKHQQPSESSQPLPTQCAQIRVSSLTPKPPVGRKERQPRTLTCVASNASSRPLPTASLTCEDLAPTRVQRLHLKNPQDKLQEMVQLQEKANQPLNQKRVKTAPTGKAKVNGSNNDQLWYDLSKAKEERLFQIDRTIQ